MSPPADGRRARRALTAAARALALALRVTGSMYGPFDPGQFLPRPPGESRRPRGDRLTRAEKRLWEELVERLR